MNNGENKHLIKNHVDHLAINSTAYFDGSYINVSFKWQNR